MPTLSQPTPRFSHLNVEMKMRVDRWIQLACILVLQISSTAWAGTFEQDFAVVYIDPATEAKFGAIPLSRSLMADGIDAIAQAGAKGLAVKFFLDQPKDEQGDKRLAGSLSRIPAVLQARIDETERAPNQLAARFTLATPLSAAVMGASGWIPLPMFASHAEDVGFVDFNSSVVPMVERYQSHTVKVNDKNQAAVTLIAPQFNRSISFNAVLDGSASKDLKNKIVILAYDGPHIATVDTALGPMGAHRYFVNILKSMYDAR